MYTYARLSQDCWCFEILCTECEFTAIQTAANLMAQQSMAVGGNVQKEPNCVSFRLCFFMAWPQSSGFVLHFALFYP